MPRYINESDIYKLFDMRGIAVLHVGDIDVLPRVEVKEVAHGRWENNHCTVCGMTPLGEELWKHLDVEPPRFEWCMDYCPCCGVKMNE
jgi:hypothetical protein